MIPTSLCKNDECPLYATCINARAVPSTDQVYERHDPWAVDMRCFTEIGNNPYIPIIQVCARYEVKDFLKDQETPKDWLVVSVREYADEDRELSDIDEWKDIPGEVLPLYMDDIPWSNRRMEGAPQVQDVGRVIKTCAGRRRILVHCWAGVSRSSALAYIIACAASRSAEAALSVLNAAHEPNEIIVHYGARLLGSNRIWDVMKNWGAEYDRYTYPPTP